MRTILFLRLFTRKRLLANPQHPPPRPTAKTHAQTTTPIPDNKNAPPFDTANMDTSVKPSDDFFMYANGGWIKRTEIPPEYSRWGSFNQLIEHNNDALHAIAEKASKTKNTHADTKRGGDYFWSGMEGKKKEEVKNKPLKDEV